MTKKIKVGDKVITKRGNEEGGTFWWVDQRGVVSYIFETTKPGDLKYDVLFPDGKRAYLYADEITRVKKKKKKPKGTLSPEPTVLRTVPVCEMKQPERDWKQEFHDLLNDLELHNVVLDSLKLDQLITDRFYLLGIHRDK